MMPFSDPLQDDLERGIFNAPSDRLAKQVYADYLEEVGDARGEFIHLHLAIEHGRTSLQSDFSTPDRLRALRAREEELLTRNIAEWLGSLAPHAVTLSEIDFGGETTIPTYVTREGVSFEFCEGLLQSLTLNPLTVELTELLCEEPELRFLRNLTFLRVPPSRGAEQTRFETALERLAEVEWIGRLRSFRYSSDRVGMQQNAMIALATRMLSLEDLRLTIHLGDARPLMTAPLTYLKELRLRNVSHHDVTALAENSAFSQLRTLRIERWVSEAMELSPLAAADFRAVLLSQLTNIVDLAIPFVSLGSNELELLAERGWMSRLRRLDLRGCVTNPLHLEPLIESLEGNDRQVSLLLSADAVTDGQIHRFRERHCRVEVHRPDTGIWEL